ncbi:MAG: hypothetical protein UY68_C0005G0001 [Parcubacteria group bacterium GW2011_GWF2_52_12]|nr:MAG: hypothetical protein UY68_C0005G0001 [Parcubacteria group bacterium GW2011_GWF2_52_12]
MDKKSRTPITAETEEIPLGILLSEEIPKLETTMSVPTSAWWTGGPDSASMDPDS